MSFQLWDSTAAASSGHFDVNGVAQAANRAIDVTADELTQTSFLTGTTSDDLWVRASDGMHWSQWVSFQAEV